MSANRNHTSEPKMVTWEQFMELCEINPICRVQGKRESATKASGQLVRFNRSVRVLVDTKALGGKGPYVKIRRVRWDWRHERWIDTDQYMTLSWRLLDWVTWKATGDPNFTWMKVI